MEALSNRFNAAENQVDSEDEILLHLKVKVKDMRRMRKGKWEGKKGIKMTVQTNLMYVSESIEQMVKKC